ncbi:SUMF1/EgtB/PvdO family nonheme iron enzyme [Luteolibacter yonseiensis]|uniref:SUMF1/EgtB/PvdO family nonheme iron enzyme n=1 Tax=Luteolibacter yonseiensis TaxID=1144680 RepID=A0A934R8M3_9BACT|nr:SUMF1/EgtB/PvdO family nonheme iron enzyme [Luteolibacter yonseiensis]MBK1818327.1 SUMF1/EgtB/PvdO family nonheme iron enzyme [Luteolibacter yonseiensis]
MKSTFRFLRPFAGILAVQTAFAAIPEVTNVTAVQRADTKFVDITYNVADADGDKLKVRVEISDNAGTVYSVPAFSFTGAIGDAVTPGNGKTITWNAGEDWDGEYSEQMRVKVIATDTKGFPGLEWGNEVPPGGFLMGQDGGAEGSGPSRHVNIPWSLWMSKYEITNGQYCEFLNMALAAGKVTRAGTTTYVRAIPIGGWTEVGLSTLILIGDTRDIRWNVNNFEVVGGKTNFPVSVTWYGALAFALQYGYDLPTDAEWEKAARGPDHDDQGEHWAYPWGNSISGGYANYANSGDPMADGRTPVGYYNGNQIPFGPDTKNAFGLYDLAGNLSEWTRTAPTDLEFYNQVEWLGSSNHSLTNSSGRITRGGNSSSQSTNNNLKIYYREQMDRNAADSLIGFRVVRRSNP